jgi:hypothetical protein
MTHEFFQHGVKPGDLRGQLLVAAGDAGHRRLGALGRAGRLAGAQPGRHVDLPPGGLPGQLLAQRLGCGEDQVTQLVACLGAGLDRVGPGHPQRPDRPRLPRHGSSASLMPRR